MLINKSVDQTKYGLTNEEKSAVAERFIRTLKTKSTDTWLQYQQMCISIN